MPLESKFRPSIYYLGFRIKVYSLNLLFRPLESRFRPSIYYLGSQSLGPEFII